jgi:hypothetical protein
MIFVRNGNHVLITFTMTFYHWIATSSLPFPHFHTPTKTTFIMENLIKKNISGKKVLFLFILTNTIYALMLAITIPKVMGLAGGMKLLDMMPTGYGPEYANTLLNVLGDKGRNTYLYNQLPLDMIYPLLFAVSYCLLLAYILNKLGKLNGYRFYLCLLPLFSGLFDYCENIGIIIMLNSYPHNSTLLTQTTSVFSILKSSSTIIYFTILTIFLIALGWRKLFKLGNESTDPNLA